jgi:quercetin dioxygenase-like cupin family protein
MMQIPSQQPHRVEALEDSVALDIFQPVRDDWLRGDDSYLRNPSPSP